MTTLLAQLKDRALEVLDFSGSVKQNEVGTFDVTVLAQDVDRDDLLLEPITMFYNGKRLISGIMSEAPDLQLTTEGKLTIKLRCLDELGRLTNYRAVTTAHFQDQLVTVMISQLLANTSDWALTDVSTMKDVNVKTTIDLRSKDTLFSQIAEIIKAVPQLMFRYGGYNLALGKHELHIGYFGQLQAQVYQGLNLLNLVEEGRAAKVYNVLESFADKSDNQRVTLEQVFLAGYAPYLTSPDFVQFPIQLDNGRYVVKNLGEPKGAQISKSFNVFKTSGNATPTPSQLVEVSFALWQASVRFLRKQAKSRRIKATITYETLLDMGNSTWIRAQVQELVPTPTYEFKLVNTYFIDQPLRCVGMSYGLNLFTDKSIEFEDEVIQLVLDLTTGDELATEDDAVELAEKFTNSNAQNKITPPGTPVLGSEEVIVTHTISDQPDVICAPDTAKEYVFPLPTPPVGATLVTMVLSQVSPPSADVTITQVPLLPATDGKACVMLGGTWPGAVDVTVTMLFIFQ